MEALREFLEFIESPKRQPVKQLLRRVLLKSREVTGAEAGTIYVVRGRGRHRRLEAANTQNDVIKLRPADFVVPITKSSIAGFTAVTGNTVFVDDLYAIPEELPYSFDPRFDEANGYCSRSMLSFPLVNYDHKVTGVVQLINRLDPRGRGPKPFEPEQADLIVPFNHIVGGAIERTAMLERIADQNKRLRERNRMLASQRQRIADLQYETEEAFQLSINLLARAAELHDEDTARHVERVNEYSYYLAVHAGLPQEFCDEIRFSAQLHDVGKMSVDSAILRKKGRLSADERKEMMSHPEYGFQILSASDRLAMAAEIALSHHERWDGDGYPNGLKNGEIPIAARIVAVADIYDALRAKRSYKPPFSHDRATRILIEGDERMDPEGHLDPNLLTLFATHHQGFAEIWDQLED